MVDINCFFSSIIKISYNLYWHKIGSKYCFLIDSLCKSIKTQGWITSKFPNLVPISKLPSYLLKDSQVITLLHLLLWTYFLRSLLCHSLLLLVPRQPWTAQTRFHQISTKTLPMFELDLKTSRICKLNLR